MTFMQCRYTKRRNRVITVLTQHKLHRIAKYCTSEKDNHDYFIKQKTELTIIIDLPDRLDGCLRAVPDISNLPFFKTSNRFLQKIVFRYSMIISRIFLC